MVKALLFWTDAYASYGGIAVGNSILGGDGESLELMYQLVAIIFWEALVFWGLLGVVMAYVCIRRLLELRRWLIVTDQEGVTLTDWRGRHTQIPWNEITAATLKTRTYLGLSSLTAVVRGYQEDVRLPSRINNREVLLEEIIAKAGLKKISQYSYVRP